MPRVDVLSLIECFPIGKAKASMVVMKSVPHFLHVFVKKTEVVFHQCCRVVFDGLLSYSAECTCDTQYTDSVYLGPRGTSNVCSLTFASVGCKWFKCGFNDREFPNNYLSSTPVATCPQ